MILREIYTRETISRVRLAELTRLSRPSVTELTQSLIERDLVLELGPEDVQDKVGKKPTLLAFNPDAYHLIGLVLTDTTAIASLLNLRMQIIEQQTLTIENIMGDPLVDQVIELIQAIRQKATCALLGITVGIPGIIDSQTGFVHVTTHFEWENLPLGQMLSDRFNLPVYVGNDSNLAAVGEYRYGHARDVKDLVVIEAGDGLGVGTLVDGRIVGGHALAAGELGHMPFPTLTERCLCGRYGCLETMVSWWSIKRRAQALAHQYPHSPLGQLAHDDDISIALVRQAIAAGDPNLVRLVTQVATYLGQAISILTHLLNPEMVIITGSMVELGDAFITQVREVVHEHALPFICGDLKIIANRHDKQSILHGAGAFLLEQELGI